ncbi:succinate--hydroxymethylglutarate CoA-transferase [Sitophilus oryzae]|uniref:Succinate--hydroxymethylglutarate CoA-transferase n=1 Tax=Sitophilus oryzae TaxID=7048 RepID=A0A6J2YX74_SITOR|nr:succinate--hydroxymethylglutarate CoA-transferase [Sitophilus oryzae]
MFCRTLLTCFYPKGGYNINKNTSFKLLHKSNKCTTKSPLEGIRVLDLTRIVAGPYCTMVLGDLGAEVIKIEKPGTGDESRLWGPPFIGETKESCYFVCFNRNKKSVCVNIQTEKGRDIIYSLAKVSDVLVENYVPGKLDSLKLGYEHIKNIAPHLIYCSITGFGPDGPYSKRPGYDVIAASLGGLLHITGPRDGEPCKVGVALVDVATGLYAHGAILAALLKRLKTGQGQKIDCDLLSTQLSTLINIGSNYLNAGKEASRWGTAHQSIVPYQAFSTKDGYYTIGTGSDKQFVELCNLLGLDNLSKNPKFETNKTRVENRDELINILSQKLSSKTNDKWKEIFSQSSFPNGPVNNLTAVFNDPHVKYTDIVKTLDHPVAGKVKVVGPPVRYSDGGNEIRSAPPILGQHTADILRDILEYGEQEINDLKNSNIIS